MLDTDHIIAVLINAGASPNGRCTVLQRLRRHAEQHLQAACAALGITVADLADNDHAVVASLLLQKADVAVSERKAALLMRFCVEAEERISGTIPASFDFSPIGIRIVQALRDMEIAQAAEGKHKAREGSKVSRGRQADAGADAVAGLFTAAWLPGMGRIKLHAAAFKELHEREKKLRDKLATAQVVGNKTLQRSLSSELQDLKRQSDFCTLHRAGNWLKEHKDKP